MEPKHRTRAQWVPAALVQHWLGLTAGKSWIWLRGQHQAAASEDGDPLDAAQEANLLRTINELLQQQVEQLRGELAQHAGEVEQVDIVDERKQRGTASGHDLIASLQHLQTENARLRSQLGLSDPQDPPPALKAEDAA